MKTLFVLLTLCSSFVWAQPALFVEDAGEYSLYFTRQQAGKALRNILGCTTQTIGSFIVEDCTAKMKTTENDVELPVENDRDLLCHFEYQGFNPDFYKILTAVCQ